MSGELRRGDLWKRATVGSRGQLEEPGLHDAYFCGYILSGRRDKLLHLMFRLPGGGRDWMYNGRRLCLRVPGVRVFVARDVWNVGIVAEVSVVFRRFSGLDALYGHLEGIIPRDELADAGAGSLDFAAGVSALTLIPSYGAVFAALGEWGADQLMVAESWPC